MMRERHPEAELAAVDSHFVNPFSALKRGATGRSRATDLLQKE
jgi:hypothetical protein